MQNFGKLGEDKAASFLTEKGYEIVERNYRYKKSEVDLICKKEELLVFVEVKTRSTKAFGQPETFVSHSQQKAILRAAEEYMLQTNWPGDILAVLNNFFEVAVGITASGETINTDLFKTNLSISGVFDGAGDTFDKSRHSIRVNTNAGKLLKEALTKIQVEKTTAPESIP